MTRAPTRRMVCTIASSVFCSASCAGSPKHTDAPATDSAQTPGTSTPFALFIGIDGLRPDAVVAANTPHMDRLQREGAWSLQATTQRTGATSSAPGWTSIFTGVEVAVHGVEANGEYDGYQTTLPTFARVAHDTLGLSTRGAAHWPEVLSSIHLPGDFDDSVLTNDDGVATTTASSIATGVHALHVLHLDDVDHAGHATGFHVDNPDYLAAVESQDARLGLILDAIDARPASEDWLIVLTTDHGGEGTDHGEMNAACQTIPLMVWGGAAAAGELDPTSAPSHLDAFPTILHHLGATPDQLGDATGTARVPPRG